MTGPSPFTTTSATPFVNAYAAQASTSPWPPKEAPAKEMAGMAEMNSEWIDAVKRAYPDRKDMPEAMRQMVQKYEATMVKTVAQRMGETSGTLESMQDKLQALKFSKQQHRIAWMKSLQSMLDDWQKNVKNYQEQQEEFSKLISMATTEIETTRSSFENLARQAGESLPTTEILDDSQQNAAAEEEEAETRRKVTALFQTCVAIGGGEVGATQVDSSSEEEGAKVRGKRVRGDGGESREHR